MFRDPGSGGAPIAPLAWGRPFVAVDRAWTRFETVVACVAVTLEVSSMSLWVFLKGLSTPADSESHGGVIFRGLAAALILGSIAHRGLRRSSPAVRSAVTTFAVCAGLLLGKALARLGVDYTSNLLNWFQQGCFLTLLGGLRGVGTRLTVLLALIGGSLATARGKHVVLDLATRLVGVRRRSILTVIGWGVSAAVAGAAAWGFFDHIAIETFAARAEMSPRQKLGCVVRQLDEDWFVTKKQLGLDLWSLPHVVVRGEGYADWLTGTEWNEWVRANGFSDRYGRDAALGLEIPPNERRAALVVVPGRGEPRGELIRDANLVFPIGLLVIAARFVLRALLLMSGHVGPEPEEEDFEKRREPARVEG